MAIYHRKLLQEPSYNQTDCSDCVPTCPYNCFYPSIYWPPQPPELQPSSTNDDTTTHISPYLIVLVAVIGSAILFISYYLIMIRYCARFRQPPATPVNEESHEFMPEIDHPIWYITTVGLQPAVINSIAVVKFKKGDRLIDVTDCSVCLSEFEDDESLRLLPKCNHAFHIPCIDAWLRSHTNCPLCRSAVFYNNSNTILETNSQHSNPGFNLSQNSQMENAENGVQETENRENERETENYGADVEDGRKENQDSKTENETVMTLRRSFSVDSSSADVVLTESNSSNSRIELQSSNHTRDSRTRRMGMMVRSFSYSGRSIV